MAAITYDPIGVIRSPFKEPRGTPIQPPAARGVEGSVELDAAYVEGLKDLDGFSHLILIYHFHLARPPAMQVKPFMDEEAHGIFAIRGPSRPNPIGLSVVRLVGIEGSTLHVKDIDVLDGTPLLDIKPFVPDFDAREDAEVRIGWLEENVEKLPTSRDDGRFVE